MELTEELVAKPHSFRHAIIMTADIAGLDSANAADAMGCAQETFSRLKTDPKTGVNPDRIESFMDNCGNELLLHNLAYRRGWYLVQRETETQRLLRIEREKREAVEEENRILRSVLAGKVA
ncbi:MAG: hypothetical protein KGI52_13545 [Burkholderiales bacterium]|nr:hypothetical protein [Burkholderiales bacterium]